MYKLFFEWFCVLATLRVPQYNSLDEGLDELLPKVLPIGEDLAETHFYTGKKWQEIKEGDLSNEVLHIFNPVTLPDGDSIGREAGSDYVKIVNGSVDTGAWAYLSGNKFALISPAYELYDLGFMNDSFFIISKHGDQVRKGRKKYRILVDKRRVSNLLSNVSGDRSLSWRGLLALLYYYHIFYNRFIPTLIILVPLTLFLGYLILLEFR